ncbi:MAG: hypothetical protein Q7R95_00540 [bacterium]|nr:hypothetical protein [bacterium]
MQFPFLQKKSVQHQLYFGLLLKEQEGIGLIFIKEQNKMVMKTYEKFTYSNGWENLTEDVDEMLFKLEHNLKIQLKETIIFVYSHLIDEQSKEIKKPYLIKIKELIKNLDLQALGYIEAHDAVVRYLEKEEETPLTAIVFELDTSQSSIFIYKGGKLIHSQNIGRTNNVVEDLIQGVQTIKGKFLLPTRIILYDSKDLSDESTKIVSHRWSEEYFVQIPRIKIIKETQIIEGLLQLFEKQILEKNGAKEMLMEQEIEAPKEIMGFLIGEDIMKNSKIENEELRSENIEGNNQMNEKRKSKFKMPSFSFSIPKLFKFSALNKGGFIIRISIILGIFIIVLALFLNEFFLHKAHITVYIPYQKLSNTLTVRGIVGENQGDIRINIATISADVSNSAATTGKRDIGDKSRGKIVIHSFDDKEKTFSKGTMVTANNLKYILDDDVKIASSSLASDGSAKLPGKGIVNVIASEIGTESNINKGQRFQIDNLSLLIFFGINESAFVGGTKRQVRTVSKIDLDSLQNKVLNIAKNQKQLQIQNAPHEQIIADLTKINLQGINFSKEVGEEADQVSLQAKATTTYYYYDDEELKNTLIKELSKDLKLGFKIVASNIAYQISDIKIKGSDMSFTITSSTKAVKDISQKDLLKSIKGKQTSSLAEIIKNTYRAEGFKYTIDNPIPLLRNFLPLFDNNISLTFSNL